MPQLYRREPPINVIEHSDDLEPTDADDSIVLSDLVRSGEASRLRRRGAMRLDHNLVNAHRADAGRSTPPVVRVARSPSWMESPSDDEESSQIWEQSYEAPLSPQTDTMAAVGPDPYCYALFCGGYDEEPCLNRPSACVQSPLPSYPPPPPSSGYQAPRWQTNGCGAVIHMRASRRDNSGVWVARNEASSAVVPLDASYFERAAVIRMVRSACGCLREGVGCAICGNPLGSRYKPCQAAAEGLFASRHHPSGPLTPEGPRYWHAHSSPLQHAQSYVYTFFAENVTSTPTPHMAARDVCPSPVLQQDFLSPIDNPYSYTFFDRIVTASPSPMSNRGRDSPDSDVSSRIEPQFDPDGVFIAADPGSPDKIGTGLTLLPER
ncbi:hypothetical protein DFH29DRAFT_243798 [Suillus ampliporus]|nr:hypothetical protein DFH29DRAFT_243798 [Suillus ampliporus]